MIARRVAAHLKIGLAACVGLLSCAAQADNGAGWVADTSETRCALQYQRDPDGILFELSLNIEDQSYAMSGPILSGVNDVERPSVRIAAAIDDARVVLSDNWESMGRELLDSASRTPVPAFIEALDRRTEQSLRLEVGAVIQTLSMAGYDAARDSLTPCIDQYIAQIDPRSQPRLLKFTGLRQLVAEASRQRLLTQKLTYTLTISPNGKPTDCAYSRAFRRKATRIALCRPLMRTMTFEPARDSNGTPVEAEYSGVIDFRMWMKQDGYLKDRPQN